MDASPTPLGAPGAPGATQPVANPGGTPTHDGALAPADPAGLPELACTSELPRAFSAQCAGCHHGAASARYPDLSAFSGDQSAFVARVRAGGGGMPAFDARTLDDDTLAEIYGYVTNDARGTPGIALGSARPLFAQAADVTPVVFTRADGVLVTRGAGRVRQRHELEGTYGPFGPHYFEDRTYGFIVEDFTVRGESRVCVTYLPVANPQDSTNFRAFKIYGDGNVFHSNTGMDASTAPNLDLTGDYAQTIAPFARAQVHEMTRNARGGRELRAGDIFEFEFGVFIDPAAVSANSRTAYYTDTFRYRVGEGGITAENHDTSGRPGPASYAWQGGGTTLAWLYVEPETAFGQMALNIQHEHVQKFVEGRRLFHTDFQTGAHSEGGNPVFSEQAGKAGPLLVATQCESCHVRNGGGATLSGALDLKSSMVFKLYGGDAALGGQLQLSEGSARSGTAESRVVTFGDGSSVTLTRPRFDITPNTGSYERASPRIARRLIGLGLLEALDEQTLLAQADPEDCDADGISGRPHFVVDPDDGMTRLGRFGWRAEKVSVAHQVADALSADMGVQTRVFPGASGAELNDEDVARLITYMRLIGLPAQSDVDDAQVVAGEAVFRGVGCASCHVPELSTAEQHPFVELRGQRIRAYTDLLLHDLGADLSDTGEARDGAGNEAATASEWRTAPLWGVGRSQVVQGHVSLLHDGRAHSVLEAVLWHGGEASAVRERVMALPPAERAALLRFVESL